MKKSRHPIKSHPSFVRRVLLLLLVGFVGVAKAQDQQVSPWNLDVLFQTPKIDSTDECKVAGFRSFYYEGIEYKGAPERVFAYYKTPAGTPPPGGWPAVVCVHGGGGTAFPGWVQTWVDHGYAAIAMDLEGHLPEGKYPNRPWHKFGGPSRITCFGDIELAKQEQWFYHAVAIVIRANSLLRSFHEINRDKIGIHGISWGGVIVSAVMGLDPRFAFAVPVYGCGYLYECANENFKKYFDIMSYSEFREYVGTWDPSLYLPRAVMPSLCINGTNDSWFPLDIWQHSIQALRSQATLRIPLRMKHGHIWDEKEIYAFADAVVKNGIPLPKIGTVELAGNEATVHVESKTSLVTTELCYTKDDGLWLNRFWQTAPAQLKNGNEVVASIPSGTKAFYFSVSDDRELTVSSHYTNLADTIRSLWYRYDRIDFSVDGRPCLLVASKHPAERKPWIWRTEFFGNQPQADLALLEKGYDLAYVNIKDMYGAPRALAYMDQFYSCLTKHFGLNAKTVLEGFSRGGLSAFNWAARHPNEVACMYVDAPVCDFKSWPAGMGRGSGSPRDWEKLMKAYGFTEKEAINYLHNPVDNLSPLAKAGIPILSVCGDADTTVPFSENTGILQQRYADLGGKIQVILKHGVGHHPHSLADPTPIVEFILKNSQ